jgi:hypothetical protein
MDILEPDVQAAVTHELCMLARSGLLQYGCCSATAAATDRAAQELCAWQRLAAEALHLFFVRRAVA